MSQVRSSLQCPSQQQVHIYLRNSQKRAHFIKIKKQIEYEQIRRIISDRIKLPIQKLVLFLKGEQLSQHGKIILNEKNIVHLVNLDNVHREYINIHIKRLEGEKLITQFKVEARSNIKEFIDTKLQEVFKHNSEEIFLVYTGKQLDISKNWEEEFVEDESELLCVNLDQSETPVNQPSAITHHSKKKVDHSGKDIELGPGKSYTENFSKKPAQSGYNAAPGSQQEIPVAPPNVWKKVNIPMESNPEDLKKPSNNTVSEPKEETVHKLHSANRPHIEDIAGQERPILRSDNPEPEGQNAVNDAAQSQGMRVQLEKEIPQQSIERISQNIAINAEIASAPATTESPIAYEAEDEAHRVESHPKEEEIAHQKDEVGLANLKAENSQPNQLVSEEVPHKLEAANVEATVSAVEEKITLEAEDEVPKVESHPQEEQKEKENIELPHQQPQHVGSDHHQEKQVSHQIVVEQIPRQKIEEIVLNIASKGEAAEHTHEIEEVTNPPITLEAEDEAPKVESQPKDEQLHDEEPHVSQEEKIIEEVHHDSATKAEVTSAEHVINDKEANQAIVLNEAEDEAPRVETAHEPEAKPKEAIEAKLESSPTVEQKHEQIPVHSEEKAAEINEEPIQQVTSVSLIDQIKGKLNDKFKHESEEPKDQTVPTSEHQPILADFNSANSLSSQVARCDLDGLINGKAQNVQELVAVGGEEADPLAHVLESAPTANQPIEEKTTSLHVEHHQELHQSEAIKHEEHEAVEEKHNNVTEHVESHHEEVHQQPEVVAETVVEEVKEPAVLESVPVPVEVDEVPHIEDHDEHAVVEANTKEAEAAESQVPIAEDEAPRQALKSSPEVEHQPECVSAHAEHEEKPVQAEHHEQVHTIQHHEEAKQIEEIHNLHAVAQPQEHQHKDEVLHSHAPEHEEQIVQHEVQKEIAEHSEPHKEVQHEAVIDHQAGEKVEHAEVHQQEVSAALESAPQEEGGSQIQKGEPNHENEHNEAVDHKESHIVAIAETEQVPVQLQSAPAHHEQQAVAEHSQKHEEIETHHVPHIQAQLHTVEIKYEPQNKQIVDVTHEEHVEVTPATAVEEHHEEIHAVESKQAAEELIVHEPEHIENIEHIEVIHNHETDHVEHAVEALHLAPEHHQAQHITNEVVEDEPVLAALESSPEPATLENHQNEAHAHIALESSPKEQVFEPKERKESFPADDELPRSNTSPQETKEQTNIQHNYEEKPIGVHHVVATHEQVEPEATLHHAVDHQAHDVPCSEHKIAHTETESALPIAEHAQVQKVHEAQEEKVEVLHLAPEEVHKVAHENVDHLQVQQKHSDVHSEHHSELQQRPSNAVAKQVKKSPETLNKPQQVEVQQVEPTTLLYGAQHHIDFGGEEIKDRHVEKLHEGIEAVLPEETKHETVSHQQAEVAAEVEPVSSELEVSPAHQQLHEENADHKTVIETPIVHQAQPIETEHTAAAEDEIPHTSLQSSPQEQHHQISSKQAEHHESVPQTVAHEQIPPHHQEYVHQEDIPVKYNETPSILQRTVPLHEAEVNAQVPEQELEHQQSDSLDEKPRSVIVNPESPPIHIGPQPTFAVSLPEQHQVPSSQVPAQHPSDHLAQIDQFFNNNPIKLQALNNPLESQLNPSNSRLSEQSQGEFEKISVPMQQHIEFKAGDLIYSGEMHLNQTENLMQDILNDYSHLLAKSPQAFQETFGAHLK